MTYKRTILIISFYFSHSVLDKDGVYMYIHHVVNSNVIRKFTQ